MKRGELPSSERDDAATKIQAAQRGHVVRQATRVAIRAEPVFQEEKRGVTARKPPPLPQPAAAPPPALQQPLRSSVTVSQAEEEGYILSRKLLSQPPADLAKWALEQIEGLQSEDKSATESPIYKLALAQRELPAEERRKLICGAVSGLRELGEEEREDISRILGGALLHGDAAEFSEASPTLLRNLQTVAQAADFPSMPADDTAKLAEELREEIVQIVEEDPQLVLDLVDELGGDERKKLLDFLEDYDVLNTEQRSTAEKTIMPGGYMDQLGSALTVVLFLYTHRWMFVVFPTTEFVVSFVFGREACTNGLVSWVFRDAILSFFAVGAIIAAGHYLQELYVRLRQDPSVELPKLQTAWKQEGVEEVAETLDMDPTNLRYGVASMVIAMMLLTIGALWALVGAWELFFATFAFSCSFMAWLICGALAALRMGAFLACCSLALHIEGYLAAAGELASRGSISGGGFASKGVKGGYGSMDSDSDVERGRRRGSREYRL